MPRALPLAPVVLALLALAAPGRAQTPERLERAFQETAERARERTVLVFGVIGMGSGAVIDPSGRVVTNAHVAAGARFTLVQWADGSQALCRQVGIDYPRDLAVLEPVEPGPARPCFTLAPARPREGAWVVALGFPGGLATDPRPTVSVGRVLPDAPGGAGPGGLALDYTQALRHDAPIFSGNSGGPLVDLEGRLVGINGAVDTERAVSLTVAVDVVRERVAHLSRGVVVLPGGLELEHASPWLRAVYRLLDPLARRLPERVAQASRALVADEALVLPEGAREAGAGALAELLGGVGDRMARTARAQPRQALLDGIQAGDAATRARLVVRLAGGGLATRVAPDLAVAKASLAGARPTLADGAACEVVATSARDDLALLRVPPAAAGAQPEDAPLRAPGSLVHALGVDGIAASGVVSVAARRASASLAASIAQGGVPAPVEQAVEALVRLADRLGAAPLQALARQLRVALEQRRAFSAGTAPRGYAQVLGIDAPLPPSAMGAPVCDRDGRLLGVAVGVPHHGTTYVVPMARLRVAFAGHLPGPRVPERLGAARLY